MALFWRSGLGRKVGSSSKTYLASDNGWLLLVGGPWRSCCFS